jgi:ABC-type transport system substrate-binding protein
MDGEAFRRVQMIQWLRPLLAGVLLVLLMACSGEPEDAGEALKVYRHAIDGAPSSLDPAQASNVYTRLLVPAIFDTLYRYKYLARPYELTPNLAEDFPRISDDGLTYEIRIRSGVRFSDSPVFEQGRGREVTARDVAWSIARHFDPVTRSGAAWLWRDRIMGLESGQAMPPDSFDVPGLEVVDATTLRIHLREPFPMLVHTLATAQSGIVPYEAAYGPGTDFGIRPVGSGPFRLVRFDETQAVLVPNEAFDRGPVELADEGFDPDRHAGLGLEAIDGRPYPLLDRLEVQFIPEASARWNSFRSNGGADIVMLPPELAGTVLADRDPPIFHEDILGQYRAMVAPEAGFVYYGINLGNPEIGDHPDLQRRSRNRELRCALGQALDWDTRSEQFYHGLGRRFSGVIPPMLPSWRPDQDDSGFDPARARMRLQSSGWTEDALPRLVYGRQSGVQQGQHFELFRANLIAIGYPADRIEQRIFPTFADLLRAINAGSVDVFLMGWTMAYPDAQYNLQLFHGPNSAPGVNSSRYRDSDFDRGFERAMSLPDQQQRIELYRSLNQRILDDCVIMGSMVRTRIHLWKRHVRMLPDREIVGGFFLRFVDVDPAGTP